MNVAWSEQKEEEPTPLKETVFQDVEGPLQKKIFFKKNTNPHLHGHRDPTLDVETIQKGIPFSQIVQEVSLLSPYCTGEETVVGLLAGGGLTGAAGPTGGPNST